MAQYELPARADEIHRALAGAPDRFRLVEPASHGVGPIEAVHDPGLVAFLGTAWEDVHREQGVTEAIPDTVVHPALRAGMGPAPAPAGAARLGFWCFETMTPLVEGTYEAARRRSTWPSPRPIWCWRRARGLRTSPAARPPRPDGCVRGLLLFQQCRHRRSRSRHVDGDQGDRARRRLPPRQRHPADLLRAERCAVRVTARRPQPGLSLLRGPRGGDRSRTRRRLHPQPAPAGRHRRRSLPQRFAHAIDAIDALDPAVIVVSLGVDTYHLDPIADFGLSTDAFTRVRPRWPGWRAPSWCCRRAATTCPASVRTSAPGSTAS